MTTISQAARDAGEQLPWGHHVYPEVVARIIQDAIDAEKASETASLRQQLEEAEHRHCLRTADAIAEKQAKEAALARVAEVERQLFVALKGKRPFSDKLAQEVIDGQVKDMAVVQATLATERARVAELEAQCAALVGLIKNAEPLCNIGRVRLQSYGEQLPELNRCLELLEMAMSSTAGASLLAHVKELEKDKARLESITAGCWTLKCCEDVGYDDADYHWEVIEYHMAEPKERMIGHGRTPREALSAAMAKDQADASAS